MYPTRSTFRRLLFRLAPILLTSISFTACCCCPVGPLNARLQGPAATVQAALATAVPPETPTLPCAGPADSIDPLLPQCCGMTGETADYGPLEVGSVVILGRHRQVDGENNWTDEMGEYIGRWAAVTELAGVDEWGCPGVHVDIDGGEWLWRVRDLVFTGETQDIPVMPDIGTDWQSVHKPVGSPYNVALYGSRTSAQQAKEDRP